MCKVPFNVSYKQNSEVYCQFVGTHNDSVCLPHFFLTATGQIQDVTETFFWENNSHSKSLFLFFCYHNLLFPSFLWSFLRSKTASFFLHQNYNVVKWWLACWCCQLEIGPGYQQDLGWKLAFAMEMLTTTANKSKGLTYFVLLQSSTKWSLYCGKCEERSKNWQWCILDGSQEKTSKRKQFWWWQHPKLVESPVLWEIFFSCMHTCIMIDMHEEAKI